MCVLLRERRESPGGVGNLVQLASVFDAVEVRGRIASSDERLGGQMTGGFERRSVRERRLDVGIFVEVARFGCWLGDRA